MNSAILSLLGLFYSGSLLCQVRPPSQQASSQSALAMVSIVAALVDRDMQVRPVPLHSIRLAGTIDTIVLRTGIDGKAAATLRPGTYALSSVTSVQFQDLRYHWNLEIVVGVGQPLEVALSNDNAIIDSGLGSADSRIDASATLFTRFQGSVYRVQAGLAHGSGFLADTLDGIILTNSHVVESAEANDISVVLDSLTRVRARLLSRDAESDVAVLRIAPTHLIDRHRIPLNNPQGKASVVPGERLAAMGYPLNQGLTITSGIASSVRAGAVISDVNINPGNSGGPLLNLDGEAVAINTFGDFASRGPGVSGSILVARAGPALARAAAALQKDGALDAGLLPLMPEDQMDVGTLKSYADTANPKIYKSFSGIDIGPFELTIQTLSPDVRGN